VSATPGRPRRRPAARGFRPRVVPPPGPGGEVAPPSLAGGLVRTLRPRQWLKNILVFGAPAAAGVLGQRKPLAYSLAAFVIFCFAASGTYCINDVVDREADRRHPVKRFRPVASGVVGVPLAIGLGTALLAVAIAASAAIGRPRLALVVVIYVAVTLAYSLWLKHEPILDLAAVAAGFVLRAIAGGVAVPVPLSDWFLIVACFGSLFVVAGKREAEVMLLGDEGESHRATLGWYTATYLRHVRSVASAVAMTAYCLWAFERAHGSSGAIWYELSIIPFVLAILRYALLVDSGHGGAPEDVVLGDRMLLVLGACLAVLFAVGVYR
jgi:decaprenyl-phosphate phosphoribosyltransferase